MSETTREGRSRREFIKDGGRIALTQSALVMEEIIGQFLFSKAEEGAP